MDEISSPNTLATIASVAAFTYLTSLNQYNVGTINSFISNVKFEKYIDVDSERHCRYCKSHSNLGDTVNSKTFRVCQLDGLEFNTCKGCNKIFKDTIDPSILPFQCVEKDCSRCFLVEPENNKALTRRDSTLFKAAIISVVEQSFDWINFAVAADSMSQFDSLVNSAALEFFSNNDNRYTHRLEESAKEDAVRCLNWEWHNFHCAICLRSLEK